MVCGITVGRKTIAGRSTSRSKKGERYRGRRRECVLLTMRVVYRPRRVLRQCLRLALYLKERISSQPESFASVSSFWFGVESPIGWVVISFAFIFFFFSFRLYSLLFLAWLYLVSSRLVVAGIWSKARCGLCVRPFKSNPPHVPTDRRFEFEKQGR